MASVLLTGANGSLAIPIVAYLLDAYPSLTLILTVRDDSNEDHNTVELRRVLSRYPNANASVLKLDLNSLKEIRAFSDSLCDEIESSKVPRLIAIICNAMTWKLSGGPAYSADGYEATFAINHLAHFALSVRLLGAMDPETGRIVFVGSQAHFPEEASLSKGFPTKLPAALDLLIHPQPDPKSEELGRGFQRYGVSKLVPTMVMYEFNRRLKEASYLDPRYHEAKLIATQNARLKSIRVITIDPLDMINSKTFYRSHVPASVQRMATIGSWLLPVLRLLMPRLIPVKEAAKPIVDAAVAEEFAGQEGYFEGRKKADSSPDSMDEKMQRVLWEKSVVWCGLKEEATAIRL
jgi:NAD(P)-dependent dehydrogenase (short-subunit alcohol dehydrogenase family)